MPNVDILNEEEIARIEYLISLKTFPERWTGYEIGGELLIDTIYNDGTVWQTLFK